MSFYRTLFAAVAAIALATPVFADDTATGAQSSTDTAAMQASETSGGTQEGASTSNEQSTKINLNTATAKELMKVKGLNASKARAIVSYRKKHGEFKSTDDLSSVKGFKKMKSSALKSIQDQLTVE